MHFERKHFVWTTFLTSVKLHNIDVTPAWQILEYLPNNRQISYISPFSSLLNINLKAVFNVTQTLLKNYKSGSSIVNISSLAGIRAFHNHAAYSASKAGVDALTRAFALELGERKIRVNSVNPTVVLTEMSIHYWTPERGDPLKSRIPLSRFCELNEVSDAILFLLSEKSSFINGHLMPLEGGFCAA